jgi:uncharacterized membrane protein YkoI
MAQSNKQSYIRSLRLKRLVPLSAFALALILVGSASAVVSTKQAEKANTEKIALPANISGALTIDQIQTLALATAPTGVTVTGVTLSQEDSTLVYKVKFSDNSFKLFDAKTGLAYVKNSDGTESSREAVPTNFVPTISLTEARTIAQTQFADKTIKTIELENEQGVVTYSVQFTDGSRVDINSTTGAVITKQSGETTTKTSEAKTEDTEKSTETSGKTTDKSSSSHTEDSTEKSDGKKKQ